MAWLNIAKHLLPRAKAWRLTLDNTLRRLIDGLIDFPNDIQEYFDLIWLDMFPATTRELDAWEYQWGLPETNLTEQERRDRLAATWAAIGGQDPSYIQATLQANGFDVYIHEWWLPASDPPEVRNPIAWLLGLPVECGEDIAECGEPIAECGNRIPQGANPYWLVNKLDWTGYNWTVLCGQALAQCGEASAECGEYDGFLVSRVYYPLPTDPDYWPYFLYFGDTTFGESVVISSERQDEFENLLLKLCPLQQWIGLFIEYSDPLVEDLTLDLIVEDGSGSYVVEG